MSMCLPRHHRSSLGFTLIEIMLVLVIMGLVAGYVVMNAFGMDPKDKLKAEAERFMVVSTMAADFAVLNQMQFGLVIDEERNRYHFAYLDDDNNWLPVTDQPAFAERQLDADYLINLKLDDFEWQSESSLFGDGGLFDETLSVANDTVNIGNTEDKPPPPPQIMLLSSGDITEFSVTFTLYDERTSDAEFTISSQGYLPLQHDIEHNDDQAE